MILQIGFLRKFRIANGAFEGFFACVQQHVTFQIARIGEAFLAHFAMYWFIHQYLLSSIKKSFSKRQSIDCPKRALKFVQVMVRLHILPEMKISQKYASCF